MFSISPLSIAPDPHAKTSPTTACLCIQLRAAYHELTPDNHKDDPNRDEKIEHHKQDSVQKAKKGDAEWKPELASSSEQAVAGDKHDMSMDEMQKMGEKKAEEGKTPSGSSSSGKH